MAVVITSTTSSQAELDHATSENWRSSAALDEFKAKAAEVEAPAKEPIKEPEAEVEQPEVEQKPEPEVAEDKPEAEQKHRGGVDKKIANVTKKWREEERQHKETQARLKARDAEFEALQRRIASENGQLVEEPATEPIWEEMQAQGKTHSEFLVRHDAWVGAKLKIEQEAIRRHESLTKKYPDWKEVHKKAEESNIQYSDPRIQVEVEKAMRDESPEVRDEITYYLLSNLNEARVLANMTPDKAGRYIAKLGSKLAAKLEAPAPAPPKPKVNPPPPIEPVTNAGSKGNLSIWDKDFPLSKMIEIRNKEQHSKGRR